MAKKEKELNPIIENNTQKKYNIEEIKSRINIIKNEMSEESVAEIDSFYKHLVDKLTSSDDIELKTEYKGINENFASVRISFFAKYYNMPYLLDMINILERKRLSLDRKSRKELVMSLENREKEIKIEQEKKIGNMFGYGGV